MFKKTRVCKLQNTEKYSDRSTIFLSQSPFVTEPYHNSFPRYACITGNIGQFSWNQIIIPWKFVEKFQFWASEKSIRSLFFCPFSLVFFCLTHFTEFADRALSTIFGTTVGICVKLMYYILLIFKNIINAILQFNEDHLSQLSHYMKALKIQFCVTSSKYIRNKTRLPSETFSQNLTISYLT